MFWKGAVPPDGILSPGAFRLLLAFAVVASHLSRLDIGRLAVLLFFYLSGYWVARMWDRKFQQRRLGRFYASRYLRIAPLYLLALIAAAILLQRPIQAENLSLIGVASSDNDPIGISWSLDVELQFYLLIPLIVGMAMSLPLWAVGVGSLTIAILGWVIAGHFGIVSVAQYLPVFVLGVLTHLRGWEPSRRLAHASLAAFVILTVVAAVAPATRSFVDKTVADPFHRDIFAFFWMLPLLPYVARSIAKPSGDLDRHLGNLSFPVYLVHYPIAAYLVSHQTAPLVAKPAALLATVLMAVGLYLVFDRPVDELRMRWTERFSPPGRRVPVAF
ncbi:acyltransferase [Phenylobacterium sp.]|uniref:acyltransferase family protein n=1 Tax=Phenylobacterium sp. TaxID=1871053 RepID=UPI002733F236|nr:acyltransferase [Phenylobacterium sp.]MDP3854857.1 acyltransferase [Phenylobacterium sp.]